MYALSYWQPWAALVVLGFKPYENRGRRISPRMQNKQILVHAGLAQDITILDAPAVTYRAGGRRVGKAYQQRQLIIEAARRHVLEAGYSQVTWDLVLERMGTEMFQAGGIVGSCVFTGCEEGASSPWANPDCYNWKIESPQVLPFMPCPGKQGFWQMDYAGAVAAVV